MPEGQVRSASGPRPKVAVRRGHPVILRVIRGRADRESVAAFRRALVETLGQGPTPTTGPDRYHVGVRPSGDELDVLVLACWASAEAVKQGDARDLSPMRIASRHLDGVDVAHFEVDMNLLRDAEVRPSALRIATGSFVRPGGDIQMQELLRARMPLLGPEMTEAYVGRRLHGRAVDVTFISAWQAIPPDQPLDEPFWSDISVRYDEFSVEVYGALQ